jgi:branched-subunit amino acid aminotransferase/4-amino-4-deoxychorismate lyase
MKLWYNGEMMNVEDAKIPLTWMSPRISSGVFDGARGYWNNKKKKLWPRMQNSTRQL